jgi:hypothetical protein
LYLLSMLDIDCNMNILLSVATFVTGQYTEVIQCY